jgi:hypothetical protein
MAVDYPIVDGKGQVGIMQSGRRSGSIAQTANFRKLSNFDEKQMKSVLFAISSEQRAHQNLSICYAYLEHEFRRIGSEGGRLGLSLTHKMVRFCPIR